MKKNNPIFVLSLSTVFVVLFSFAVEAQVKQVKTVPFIYGTANTAFTDTVQVNLGFAISISSSPHVAQDVITNFRSQTKISYKPGAGAVRTLTLDALLSFLAGTTATKDTLSKEGLIRSGDLTKLHTGEITIDPYLGPNVPHFLYILEVKAAPPAASTPTATGKLQLNFDTTGFTTGEMTEDAYKKKYDNLVIYRPCDNTYKIYYKGKEAKAFWYKGTGNTGSSTAVLLIDNFNTAMYTVSATNTFISYASTIPSVFTTVTGLFSATGSGAPSGAGAIVTPGQPDPNDFADFIILNTSLKKLLSYACGNFQTVKKQITTSVNQSYPYGISAGYQAFLAKDTVGFPKKKLMQLLTDKLGLVVSPDSIIKQDVQLYATLLNTSFTYQYNVVQLQNVDQIQFLLTVSPVASTAGTPVSAGFVNVVSQPLNIPVLGGLKFDFSTGFYYSSVKNLTYALQTNPNPVSPTLPVSIVKENDYKGGTAGIGGLLHVYYPFNESWTPDLCIGVGTSTALNYSMLAGGGVMFTVAGQNKISLSGGYNLSNIKKLSNGEIGTDGNPISLPATVTTITYANNFKHGCFFSLTYSFGLTKSTQPASSAAPAATSAASASPAAAGGAAGSTPGSGTGTHGNH